MSAKPVRIAELLLLFVAAPIAMAVWLPPSFIWQGLASITVIGIILLALTDDFKWRTLVRGKLFADPMFAILFTAAVSVITIALTLWLAPRYFYVFPAARPTFWLIVIVAYPIVSVIPQELIYRPLFFRRYGDLFPSRAVAIAANAGVFGLAHLFYWNIPSVALTIVGGAIFAWAYEVKGSFAFACLLHAIAGWILFTVGLGGRYFFHGTVPAGFG